MNRRLQAVSDLEVRVGHVFADRLLLDEALTHASVRAEGAANNERLEFLGDRVLALIIAEALSVREPGAGEGELTIRFQGLVKGEACARVARDIGLGEALRLTPGEAKRGAREQTRILGDTCEALIAALYLELGLDGAKPIVLKLWAPLLDEPHDRSLIDPKTELQEWAVAQGRGPPDYRVVERSGPAHQPLFTVEVSVGGESMQTASGGTVRAAEKAAALKLLRQARGQA